jgi:general stress protein 26
MEVPRISRPHSMPVWDMWDDSTLWFTCGVESRKARNLRADSRCVVTTQDAGDPVIIEGTAGFVTDSASIRRVLDLMNDKYNADRELSFLDPAVNATIAVRPPEGDRPAAR